MRYESERLYVIKNGRKEAMVRRTHQTISCPVKYSVSYYMDGMPRNGLDICDTIEEAKNKADAFVGVSHETRLETILKHYIQE